jgi:very-short-patch-repair endonuclease
MFTHAQQVKGGKARAKQFNSEYQKAARARVKRESLVRAGKAGYQATGERKGWSKANEYARRWRLGHPSEPERWVMSILDGAGIQYEREYPVLDRYSIDLARPDERIAIEVNGHQHKASFGEDEPRAEKHAEKCAALEGDGWTVHIVHAADDREKEAARLLAFLHERGVNE